MNRWLLFAGCLVALIAVLWVAQPGPSTEDPTGSTQLPTQTPTQPPPAIPTQAPSPPSGPDVQRQSQAARPAQEQTARAEPPPTAQPAADAPPIPPQRSEGAELFERAYAQDSTSGPSGTLAQQVSDILNHEAITAEDVYDTTCHDRVCRVRLRWSTARPQTVQAAIMLLGYGLNENVALSPQRTTPDEAGEIVVDLYVLRPGLGREDL